MFFSSRRCRAVCILLARPPLLLLSAPVLFLVALSLFAAAPAEAQSIRLRDSSVSMNEDGGAYEMPVWLTEQPTSDVTVAIASEDTTVATVHPDTLTFSPANYGVKQTVTYTAVDDDVSNDPLRRTTIAFTASGGGYDGVSHTAIIELADDEGWHFVLDEGSTERLPHRWFVGAGCPATMSFESSDTSVLTVDPSILTWTEEESGATKYLTVSVLDNDEHGDGMATISRSVHDPPCSPLDVPDIVVTVRDNDIVPVLSVAAIPVCSAAVSDISIQPTFSLGLAPASDEEVATDYRWRIESTVGQWLEGLPSEITFSQLHQNPPRLFGFDFRLRADHDVTAQCIWQFDDESATGAPSPPKLTPDSPMYLRATPGNGQVTLTWSAPLYDTGDITGYTHRYKESNQIFGFDAPAEWNGIPGEADARNHTITGLTNGLEYAFEVRAENEHGGGTSARAIVRLPITVGAESEELPTELTLMGNYPNPFNPQTTIDYALPQTSHVRLAVYDMTGRPVAALVDGMQPQGRHAVRFHADGLPTGTYVYRLSAGGDTLTQTMTLVR